MRNEGLMVVLLLALGAVLPASCGGDDADSSLNVTWTFDAGDCAANGVATVRVTWGPQGGAMQTVEFACEDGSGNLGDIGDGGTYSITAQGLDASGVALA